MKRSLRFLLLLGLVQVVAYCVALQVPEGGSFGSFDQDCYAQSARRIAAGFPFSYSPGLPASTGQTSVLYPFLLAIPAAFGAEGNALHLASMVLASFFYLVFLAGWGIVIVRLFPTVGVGRLSAILMTALSGVCAYTAFTMTDQGLWMAVSAVLAAAMVAQRRGLTLALLCLAPWVRPEGMMLVVSVVGVEIMLFLERRGKDFAPTFNLGLLLPLLSLFGVFALNYALTGQAQFSSVSGKGYFCARPFPDAVRAFGGDLLAMAGTYLCSFPSSSARIFAMSSPVVAACFWIGLFAHAFRGGLRKVREFRLLPFVLAALLAIASVASGGFAGLDFDRYLAWLMPLVFLTAAAGLEVLVGRTRSGVWRKTLLASLVLTVLFSSVAMVAMMRRTAGSRAACFATIRAEAARLPEGASVGSEEFVWAYELPASVRYRELTGLFTPAFAGCAVDGSRAHEMLKRDPSLRFDYWVEYPLEAKVDTPENRALIGLMRGAPLVAGPGPHYLRRADWSCYDRANESPIPGREPVARLDIGYAPDERAAGLRAEDGSCRANFRAFCLGRRASDGQPMCEGCALVTRGHTFALDTRPGLPAVLVLRTIGTVTDVFCGQPSDKPASRGARAPVKITVGGRLLGEFVLPLQPDVFTDYRIEVPAEYLTAPRTDFHVEGRFFVFGYWLYQ